MGIFANFNTLSAPKQAIFLRYSLYYPNSVGFTPFENANAKITKFGRILRATSIDELPQLFNILNGTMSLVGPRPLIPEETEIRELREKYNVYTIRPGITGWAQVNGRDNISLEQKALLDKEYVEKQSLGFDIKILVMTVLKVLRREDVNEGNNRA